MNQERFGNQRPGKNDRAIVEEMLRDRNSLYWNMYHELIQKGVAIKAKDLPPHTQDEIAEDCLSSLYRSLSTFRFDCSLTTWITYQIIPSRVSDARRRIANEKGRTASLDELQEEATFEQVLEARSPKTPEQMYIESESESESRHTIEAAFEEFITTHKKPERNRQILIKVFLEGRSIEDTAREERSRYFCGKDSTTAS